MTKNKTSKKKEKNKRKKTNKKGIFQRLKDKMQAREEFKRNIKKELEKAERADIATIPLFTTAKSSMPTKTTDIKALERSSQHTHTKHHKAKQHAAKATKFNLPSSKENTAIKDYLETHHRSIQLTANLFFDLHLNFENISSEENLNKNYESFQKFIEFKTQETSLEKAMPLLKSIRELEKKYKTENSDKGQIFKDFEIIYNKFLKEENSKFYKLLKNSKKGRKVLKRISSIMRNKKRNAYGKLEQLHDTKQLQVLFNVVKHELQTHCEEKILPTDRLKVLQWRSKYPNQQNFSDDDILGKGTRTMMKPKISSVLKTHSQQPINAAFDKHKYEVPKDLPEAPLKKSKKEAHKNLPKDLPKNLPKNLPKKTNKNH